MFARTDGSPWPPDGLATAWQKAIAGLKLPKVTLQGLRHTHVSQLIATGLDVVTVRARIGHGNPTVTLTVYAHLFGDTDERAARAVGVTGERIRHGLRERFQPSGGNWRTA